MCSNQLAIKFATEQTDRNDSTPLRYCTLPSAKLPKKERKKERILPSLYIYFLTVVLLTSHPRSTAVLLDTSTSGTSREIYREDAELELELATPWL